MTRRIKIETKIRKDRKINKRIRKEGKINKRIRINRIIRMGMKNKISIIMQSF